MAVGVVDHVIGLLASTLTRDGGTLQIGIGSLGDAIAYALRLRHQDNTSYRAALAALDIEANFGDAIEAMGGLDVFEPGLYGSREMFIHCFLELYQSGILKREVYPDEIVQRLVNEGKITSRIDKNTLAVLLEAGAVHPQLTHPDVDWLRKFGFFRETVSYEDGSIRVNPDLRIDVDLTQEGAMDDIVEHLSGRSAQGGVCHSRWFFLSHHQRS